jgi:hypothetical protein
MSIMKYIGVRSLYSSKDMVIDKKPSFMNDACVECCFSNIRATPDLDGKIRDAWRCSLHHDKEAFGCEIMRIIRYYDACVLKEHMKEKDKSRSNTTTISTGHAYIDEGGWHFNYDSY